jgi:formate dehydrogenase iron-sulfur subunit
MAVGALLAGTYAFLKRRASAIAGGGQAETSAAESHSHHPEFESLQHKLLTPFNKVLLGLMTFGAISLIARFALGLGGSTHLSDTYAWGLWIVFDLVWIAVAAGAFATAGLIYVFQRKDLYSVGRSAVLLPRRFGRVGGAIAGLLCELRPAKLLLALDNYRTTVSSSCREVHPARLWERS